MSDQELIEQYIRSLETEELIELYETLINEVNNPVVIWDKEFFLEDLVMNFINSYDCIKYSNTIKNKLEEIKEETIEK